MAKEDNMPYDNAHEQSKARSQRKKRVRRRVAIVLVLLLLVGGSYGYAKFQDSMKETITNAPARTYEAYPADTESKTFDEAAFSFEAPKDWKLVGRESGTVNKFSYQSTKKNFDARNLDIYMDKLPPDMAVNRTVAVKSQGATLSHGEASENCTSFATTNQAAGSTANQLVIRARWDGVEFLCDNDTKFRNIFGTTSAEGINKVVLTGPKTGPHTLFFVYTDHTSMSDHTIFYKMLESFKVK